MEAEPLEDPLRNGMIRTYRKASNLLVFILWDDCRCKWALRNSEGTVILWAEAPEVRRVTRPFWIQPRTRLVPNKRPGGPVFLESVNLNTDGSWDAALADNRYFDANPDGSSYAAEEVVKWGICGAFTGIQRFYRE